MDKIALLPRKERRDLFRETSARMGGVHPLIPEKDFWVSWVLDRLFVLDGLPRLLFKGGTSLSKAYGLIERFSEDIDLAIERADLGFAGDRDPLNASSRSRASALIKELDSKREECVNEIILPGLEASVRAALGDEVEIVGIDDGHTIEVRYPAALSANDYAGFPYVAAVVKIEIGARSDQEPVFETALGAYVTDHFPGLSDGDTATVRVLAAERTFWEKATILHVEAARPGGRWRRVSRHAYDLYQMIQKGVGEQALDRLDLLEAVRRHKSVFFRSAWADYDSAAPGTLVVKPRGVLAAELRRDYAEMQAMLFGDPPTWDAIVASLKEFEERVNGANRTLTLSA